MELGVAEPVPILNAPTVSRQSQQGFRACAQAGEKKVFGDERLAVAGSCGGDLIDPARQVFRSINWILLSIL
jgi:hypothetical protein